MTSKKQLIDEIFATCDSILEKSDKNQQTLQMLIQKYPLNEAIQAFQQISVNQFEDLSRNQLKQLSIEQLEYMLEDVTQVLDHVMNEELQINKLGLRISKTPLEIPSHESWDFLLQWPNASNIDSIIINVKSITTQLHRSTEHDDDLQTKYMEALNKIESLEKQLTNRVLQVRQQPKDKLEIMDELERKLHELEMEKEQMSQTSMDAFSRLLSTKL